MAVSSNDMTPMTEQQISERRTRARRTAILFGLIALSFYVAFIAMSVARS